MHGGAAEWVQDGLRRCRRSGGVCLLRGQTGAEALFDVLDGTVGPAGRQPFTIERRRDDSPGATATKPVANGATYPLDYLHGDFFKDKV